MECPVCFEIYNIPLLLPGCGHTICKSCAEMIISDVNFLRCPECRLVYQLRQGIRSLPKNVALQRTIDEYRQKNGESNSHCEEHPDHRTSLYCKTCEKSICLKCFFGKQQESVHSNHQVDTSEDALSREMRLLRETRQQCEENLQTEEKYLSKLEETHTDLKTLMDEKLKIIDSNKQTLISQVKQTAGKLKFVLKGSIARDSEFIEMAIESSNDRLCKLKDALKDADILYGQIDPNIDTLKETKRKFEGLDYCNNLQRPTIESFMGAATFDTDLESCLHDHQKALSYQTEVPRQPTISVEESIVSDTSAYIRVHYEETVRTKSVLLFYREAMYKGMSEKLGTEAVMTDRGAGVADLLLQGLNIGTMYRLYVVARNDFGSSEHSKEFWCRTAGAEIEKRLT